MFLLLKISLRVGLITSCIVVLYEVVNQLYLYHYFRYEYYLAGIAIAALLTGILLSRKYFSQRHEPAPGVNPLNALTAKELNILQLICQGKSNKEIAAENFVELSTVKTHINNLYGKLGVSNRKEAMKLCGEYLQKVKSTLSPPL